MSKSSLITEGRMMDEATNMSRGKVKMEEVREENERLKLTLSQMMKDYNSLKMQFNDITQEDQSKKPTNLASMATSDDESELVSLSLGRFSADHSKKKEEIKNNNDSNNNSLKETKNLDGIELGLNCKSHLDESIEDSRNLKADENSLDESKEEEKNDARSSGGSPTKNSRVEDEDILQHNPLKKPRVSVRAVCNTQTMHDGCQWRKYGQKISKGNPCPRAYYRCTVSSSCPVRKQVQRCIDDMSILMTTYEGAHNHPLPASATTMASATSAAAAMLSCGSSTSSPPPPPTLLGFNNYPRTTISTLQSHPTVILDLTAPNQFSSPSFSAPTSLNFSSKIGWETKFPTINSVTSSPYSHPPLFPNMSSANDHKIAAAITHDPNFQSALAAAITSFVGRNNNVSSSGMNFSQQKSFAHFAPLTLSASKPQPMSLADEGQQIKL